MLITLLSYRESLSFEDIVFMLLGYAVVIFVALPFHEMAHAFAADRLGDHTAKWNGRLTMNPLKHLDVLGTVMICLCGFGYAKPVPVNPYNFKHPKRDMALTALAGPLSNLLMAALSLAIFRVLYTFVDSIWFLNMAARVLISTFASINHRPGGVQPAAYPAPGRIPDLRVLPARQVGVHHGALFPVYHPHHHGPAADRGPGYSPELFTKPHYAVFVSDLRLARYRHYLSEA